MKEFVQGKISLSKVFSESIHLPTRKEDTGIYPLYPHKAGSEIAKRTIRSAGWHKESNSNYNSPGNIRAVCLDQYRAVVSYWNTPIVYGRKQDIQHPLIRAYEDGDAPVLLDPYRLYSDNAGLSCLVRDYVCSNIEELWITAEAFGVAGNRNPDYVPIYQKLRSIQPGQVFAFEELASVFAQELKRDIRTTFPLLRCIVVVVKPLLHIQRGFVTYAQRTPVVSTYLNETYPNKRMAIGECPALMQDIANKSGFGYAVCLFPGADILKFSLGDYKYDETYLAAIRDIIVKKYSVTEPIAASKSNIPATPVKSKKFIDESVEEKVANKAAEPETTSLLEIINDLEQAGYSKYAINTALYAYRSIDINYIKEQVALLPREVVEKYKASIGGELTGNRVLFVDKKNRKSRFMALARLAVEPPTEHLHNMIMSAYKEGGKELDIEYIEKYKSVYNALFDLSTVAVIRSRLIKDGYNSADKIQKIREQRQGGTNADIVPLIAAMQFSLNCGNPSGFADFDTKDDVDLTFDKKHIIEQCTSRIMACLDMLYADVFNPLKTPKGTYATTVPGYPDGVLCHNTAHNVGHRNTPGNDSVLKLKGPASECVRAFYNKTLCNAVLTTDNKKKKCCIESGAVSAEILGADQLLYFPRQAGRFASGVVLNKQRRHETRAGYMRAVRKWIYNRLMAVYTFYSSRTANAWELSEAIRRAAKSLSMAFIVSEYEEDGIPMLRISSNMFAVGVDELKALSTSSYTVLDVVQTDGDDFKVYTVTVALQGGLNKAPELDTIEEQQSEEDTAQKAVDARADLIYEAVAKALKEKGFVISALDCTQPANRRAFGLDKTTHRFEVFKGAASNIETRTQTIASAAEIAEALDLYSDI